jgi:hypothetical protein
MLYNILVFCTFFIKICFLLSIIALKFLKDPKTIAKLTIYKGQLDFVYILLMSVILFVNFGPWVTEVTIGGETKLLLFLYGIIILLTANYNVFDSQSIVLKSIFDNNQVSAFEKNIF